MKTGRLLTLPVGLVAFVFWMLPCAHAQSVPLTNAGTGSLHGSSEGADGAVQSPEFDPAIDLADAGDGSTVSAGSGQVLNRTLGGSPGPGVSAKSGKKAKSNPMVNLSFDGLNHRNQRLANGGNQFSLEPPDQGLCGGNGFVMEAINDVLRVYDTQGNPQTGVVDLNTFYGYAAAINRSTVAYGPEITDPSCYFDQATQRWFLTVLTLDRVGTTSALSGTNHLDIAVSTTASPLDPFIIYRLPVQNDGSGGTPNHHCVNGPCFGDYPHIGADANGFYITTNEFNFFAPGFRASQIYVLSKQALVAGTATSAINFDTANSTLDGNPGFTVWPAISPGTSYSSDAGGTEYLLSAVANFSVTRSDNRLRIWAISNTQSLNTSSPAPLLNTAVVNVGLYSIPPKAGQRIGDIPLGDCINDTTTTITSLGPPFVGCWKALFGSEPAHNEAESQHIDSNDARMQQVVFANGKLWAALDTGVTMTSGTATQTKAGIAYFILKPTSTASSVSGTVALQGVFGLLNNDLTYPAVGVTSSGRGVIAFTLLGAGDGGTDPGNFPSAAYVPLDAQVGAGAISVIAAGAGPDDGFTAYKAYVGNGRNRWGDYGATFTVGNAVWIASEYIGQTCSFSAYIAAPFGACPVNGAGTRTSLANWYTRITELTP
jgi:hypothetical protein